MRRVFLFIRYASETSTVSEAFAYMILLIAMPTRLSLVQLNIELDRHLGPVIDFLKKEKPEVACVQELLQSNIPLLEKALDAKCFFAPMCRRTVEGVLKIEGMGIFSRLPVLHSATEPYAGSDLPDASFDHTSLTTKHRTRRYSLSWCDVEKEGVPFRIVTTHFTWTPDGAPNEFQRKDIRALTRITDTLGELILCGDFNAPRGGEIFSLLAERFMDNIPLEYTTSLDSSLHRAGPLELMVDGIFSTNAYRVSGVQRHCGVSDHCAFTAFVEHAERDQQRGN